MKIVIATGNKGKIREIKELLPEMEVCAYSELIAPFEIIEDANTFKGNAIIKARAVYDALGDVDAVVLSDDSGISVPAINNEPGIYSARYAGEGASDKENLYKLIDTLKNHGISRTEAFYTCAIAVAFRGEIFTTHGFMHGDVIDCARGKNGFGYDPMFIPAGYEQTLGELDDEVKKSFSHRSKALKLAKTIIAVLNK